MDFLPIVYVRGYAGTQGEIEETVDDPFYGFNKGSTHIRVGPPGRAQFFAFESPLVRLMTDHRYGDVFEGERQRCRSADGRDPKRIIWVYRYYDPSSRTFDRDGRGRLSIEECAEGLRSLILRIRAETGAEKVHLVAHSMGGLICRSLIQKIFPDRGEAAYDHIDKFFTYGTPHGGIHFDVGGGAIEWIRDRVGWNNADDFGRQRMYEYLTPRADKAARVPEDFRAYRMDPRFFPLDRVFCAVGTNARDYDVAHGLSRATVGPRSDGLVQIGHAYLRGSHRAYIHRSHSGRYGMVNSEEGYQNLQRFLFGDVKVKLLLCDARLEERENTFYQAEAKVAIRGLPVIIHEQVLSHHSQIPLPAGETGPVPLFTAFLN